MCLGTYWMNDEHGLLPTNLRFPSDAGLRMHAKTSFESDYHKCYILKCNCIHIHI